MCGIKEPSDHARPFYCSATGRTAIFLATFPEWVYTSFNNVDVQGGWPMFGKSDRKKEPRSVNYLWVLAGGYLVYLGGNLIYSVIQKEATSMALKIIAGVRFIGVGGAVCMREWRIYRYGSKEEREALAKEQMLREKQTEEENREDKI